MTRMRKEEGQIEKEGECMKEKDGRQVLMR